MKIYTFNVTFIWKMKALLHFILTLKCQKKKKKPTLIRFESMKMAAVWMFERWTPPMCFSFLFFIFSKATHVVNNGAAPYTYRPF